MTQSTHFFCRNAVTMEYHITPSDVSEKIGNLQNELRRNKDIIDTDQFYDFSRTITSLRSRLCEYEKEFTEQSMHNETLQKLHDEAQETLEKIHKIKDYEECRMCIAKALCEITFWCIVGHGNP